MHVTEIEKKWFEDVIGIGNSLYEEKTGMGMAYVVGQFQAKYGGLETDKLLNVIKRFGSCKIIVNSFMENKMKSVTKSCKECSGNGSTKGERCHHCGGSGERLFLIEEETNDNQQRESELPKRRIQEIS
jgi:hypothetical protein